MAHSTIPGMFVREMKPYIEELVEMAASAVPGKDSEAEKKLKAVINFWAANQYISREEYKSYRERAMDGLVVAQGGRKRRTYALPVWFGDRTAPWHELPASYMLEPMIRHPDRPIARHEIKVKRYSEKQPSERVRQLLEEYFENIDLKYLPTGDNPTGETKKYKLWLDPMGQLVKQNKETRETKTVCNGYGWSVKFCQDMQDEGVPEALGERREEYREEQHQKRMQDMQARERNRAAKPRSPGRRPYSSSSDKDRGRDYRRDSGSMSRSRSTSSSVSRGSRGDRDESYDRRRQSSRDGSRDYPEGSSHLDDRRHSDQRPLLNQYGRPSRWSDRRSGYQQPNRGNYGGPGGNNYNNSNYPGQGFSQASQPPNFPASYPPPSPMAGQVPGYPNAQFPPPPPPPFGAPGTSVPPPPPPPNYNGPYPGAPPNMGGYQNNPYNYGNSNFAYGNQGGYGGQAQGGSRGGFGGGFQGRGGYNQRGGYHRPQQGRGGGSRWS
ncbi:hypothetical protein BU26DRAFT_521533 [Trematosphaeria pertusa]|uniref:CID domain-containing protein n=1 Tax=Trematosphaeria pertusa TaxID=390896 RepID=A0A6A6I917_9PLEO|nr:uncharacterized protein BU26DRAFT_521533 [Trematosphaeria pertusa]KAF2246013.1 hypothetical protein BU26DRAFT_521533 [Trematosphaeria pertusa]